MMSIRFTVKALAATAFTYGFMGQAGAKPMKMIKVSDVPPSVPKPVAGEVIVKCAGIAAKGKNHCGANNHPCSGYAKTDFDKNEWVYVRKGVCEVTPGRIVGQKKVIAG